MKSATLWIVWSPARSQDTPLPSTDDGSQVSGTIYVGGEDYESYTKLMTKAYGMFAWTNPLHAGVFPGVRQMEAEVIAMVCNLFNGGSDACGAMSSGGTESILLSVKVSICREDP